MAGMNRNFMNQMPGQSMQPYSNLMNNVRQQQQVVQRPLIQQQQNFGNATNQQVNQHMSQLNNNPAMLQAALTPGHPFSRQFVRLGQAQQQRPQNGPLDSVAFTQQNPQMNGHNMGIDQVLGAADGQSTQRMPPSMMSATQFHDQVIAFIHDKEGRRLAPEDLNIKLMNFMRETEEHQHKLDNIQHSGSPEVQNMATRVNARNVFAQLVRQRYTNEYSMGGQPR